MSASKRAKASNAMFAVSSHTKEGKRAPIFVTANRGHLFLCATRKL